MNVCQPQLNSLDNILTEERNKPIQPKPQVKQLSQNMTTYFLVWGLIVIQIIAFLMALAFTSSAELSAEQPDRGASLDAPHAMEMPFPLPDQPIRLPKLTQVEPINTPQIPLAVVVTDNLRIRGVEVTQAIQVFHEPELDRCQPDPHHPDYIFCNNSVSLIAGRNTMVRVYLACNGNCPPNDTTIQLVLRKDDLTQNTFTRTISTKKLQAINNLPMTDLRLNLENSVNFEFLPPPAWLSGLMTFEVKTVPSLSKNDMVALAKDFVERRSLRIAYLPIVYKGIKPAELPNANYWLQRIYPVSKIEYYHLPIPDLVWEGTLNKNEILRKLLFTYWLYALHHPVEEWPDQLFGWLPQEFFNGGVSDPFFCPQCSGPHSSRVGFGGIRPEFDIGGPRILVHELAHNFGAQHAWSPTQKEDVHCFKGEGVDIQVDPTWPYPESPFIQEVGLDLYSQPPIIYPPSDYDMMAYCAKPWISPYSYQAIFDSPFLEPNATIALPWPDFKPKAETGHNGALLVSGVVYPDGTVSNPEIIQLEGESMSNLAGGFSPPTNGNYCVNVRDGQNKELGEQCFAVGFTDAETGEITQEGSSFFVTLPNIDLKTATEITIRRDNKTLSTLKASSSPPKITVTYPNGGETLDGEQMITWQASDADGEPLVYDVLYSLDKGQSWSPLAVRLTQSNYAFNTRQLSSGDNALIQVIASDGFYSTADESDNSFSLNSLFENSFSLHGPSMVKPGQSFEITLMANHVTAPGLFEVQFNLNFEADFLQVEQIQLLPDLNQVAEQTIQNEVGQVKISAKQSAQAKNLTGDITLATFTVIAKEKQGKTQLSLGDFVAKNQAELALNISEIWDLSLQVTE